MSDYKECIRALKSEGEPYTTFINDDGDMVIRFDYGNDNYAEFKFNGVGKHIEDVFMFNGEMSVFTFAE